MTTAEITFTESVKGSAKALGFGVLALGGAMAVMAFIAPVDAGPRAAEAVAGALAAIGGTLLLARGAHAAMTAGAVTLLASLVYLAVTNTEFHEGGVGYSIAVAQFVTVPIGLVLGGIAFALTPETRTTGRMNFVPDGVILVVGTILLGIGLGQIGNERLMTPKWNWVSFLGLTITGMLVLVLLRGALKAAVGGDRRGSTAFRFLGPLAPELLLVGGLAVMMYGALNNLVLGANGFRTGFEGNGDGLALWIAAALFLVVVRGGFKFTVRNQRGVAQAVVRELLYFAGVFAFIVGERSVISGKPPGVPIGDALPAAAVILLGALFLLVPVRMAAKQGRLRARHG
ncbi:MAG: hypothetical protein M3M94_00990 [Actinomycetota bacterium]|nr:hypothetical protein [Actinomycetota bacterium]